MSTGSHTETTKDGIKVSYRMKKHEQMQIAAARDGFREHTKHEGKPARVEREVDAIERADVHGNHVNDESPNILGFPFDFLLNLATFRLFFLCLAVRSLDQFGFVHLDCLNHDFEQNFFFSKRY